jgi:hypothetical protein
MDKRSLRGIVLWIAAFMLVSLGSVKAQGDKAQFLWEPIKYAHGSVVQVGNTKLPWPVTFPANLKPAGDVAFVARNHPAEGWSAISFYFHAADEAKFKAWASAMPKGFPLPKGTYTINYNTDWKHSRKYPDRWFYGVDVKTKNRGVGLLFDSEPWDLAAQMEADRMPEESTPMAHAMLQPPNPTLHEKRLLALGITFFSKKGSP